MMSGQRSSGAEGGPATSWSGGAEGGRAASCEEQQQALCQYTTDTLTYIDTVRGFCEGFSTWMDAREEDLLQMRGIKGRAVKADLSFSHLIQLVGIALWACMKALWGCVKAPREEEHENMLTQDSTEQEHETPETKLATVLTGTLGGLEELDHFLDAVEKLAVTSLHVFMEENQVLHLPKGISLKRVQAVIIAARLICPLLLEFKRDARAFFLPKLQNVEVLSDQLYKYIKTTRKICEKLEKSLTTDPVVDLHVSEEGVPERLCDIKMLNEIRMGEHFRTVFLFKDESRSDFINKFSTCEPGMLTSLKHLEDVADNLNCMNIVAKSFRAVGSGIGTVGGIVSIVGLSLIPATAGVVMTFYGACLGIVCTVIIVLGFFIDCCCNQKKKTNKHFQSFLSDMQSLHDCLENTASHPPTHIQESEIDVVVGVGKVFHEVCALVKFIDLLADIVGATDIPDIWGREVKGPLANLSLIAPNVLSFGMDVFLVFKQVYSLARCNKTEVSQFIRARAALWRSQLNSWKKIHDSLCEGQRISEEHRAVLDKLFNQGGQ